MMRFALRVGRTFSTKHSILNDSIKSLLEVKYADKLKAKMEKKGVHSLDKLKASLPSLKNEPVGEPRRESVTFSPLRGSMPHCPASRRQDSSPIKPLSSFLNTSRIVQTPHTAEQISSLWLVYHASRSNGTGQGYISASMSRSQYEAMLARARRYSVFILPLGHSVDVDVAKEKEATEFYFMQWGFYDRAEPPSHVDPSSIDAALSPRPQIGSSSSLPHVSSIILTPLQEYKLRGTYAQVRLVITHYPEFSDTHDLVLLRGEIAQSSSGSFLLSQTDAQILALMLQRFYMPSEFATSQNAFELLRAFHEAPDNFDYQKLIEAALRV